MDDPLDPNSTLPARFGRYQVLSAIPGGAMGRLYLGQDPEIDRMVVIKALDSGSSQEQKTRFLREARAAGRLNHPNVVAIFDVGEHDRMPFIVMEYIEGETLSAVIRNREPMPFSKRLEIVDQLCAGLAYAHDQGVVHRDIKPSNLMLDKTGKLRILDFGIARLDTGDATQTSTGIVGTLNYMSPEQWEGGVIEGKSDMFSVGAVMYELFSFAKAFPGNTPPEVLRYMFGEGPRPLREVCPLAPPALAEVVARMLARTPSERYASLHEVRSAIAALRAQVQEMALELGDKTMPMSGVPSMSSMGWSGPPTSGGTRATGAMGATGATGPTGWPVRPGATASQTPFTGAGPAIPPLPAAPPVPGRGRAVQLISLGAAGVVLIGVVGWLMLRGASGGTGNPGATGAAAPAPVTPSETSASPPGALAANQAASGGAAADQKPNSGQKKSPPAAGTRGTATSPAPAAAAPPSAPAAPVDLTITWSQPFEVFQGSEKLTTGPKKTQTLKAVHPEKGDLQARNDELRLRHSISTEKSASVTIPEPGRLAVTLTPPLKPCSVWVDGTFFKKGSILPDRSELLASGRHAFSLKCDNGKTEPSQTVEVKSGSEPTIVNFPKDGGG